MLTPPPNAQQAHATRGYQRAVAALSAQLVLSWLLNLVVLGVVLCIALLSLNVGLVWGAWAAIAAAPLSLYGVLMLVGLLQAHGLEPEAPPRAQLTLELEQHPQLLELLKQLCEHQQVAMPRQVRLNPDVNAAVMVDHKQRGYVMILGLGMLNALDVEALRAVLAHELAHAGQRAMTLGLLVERTHRARWHLMTHHEDGLTAKASRPWRMLLLWDAQRLARRYKALIYHMELDADAKATTHTSAQALVRAINRLEHADVAMQLTLEELDQASRERQYTDDIFLHHRARLAQLPHIKSRRSDYGDHPSDRERAQHAQRHKDHGEAPADERESWALFEQPHLLSQHISALMWRQRLDPLPTLQPAAQLEQFLARERALLRAPDRYAGLYDPHGPVALSAPSIPRAELTSEDAEGLWASLDELAQQRAQLEQDAQALKAADQTSGASVIWRGQRYERRDLEQLEGLLIEDHQQWERRRIKAHETLWALAYQREAQQQLEPALERRADVQRVLRWALEQHQHLQEALAIVGESLKDEAPRTAQQEEHAHETLTVSFEILEALLNTLKGAPSLWLPQDKAQPLDQLLSPSPLIEPATRPGDRDRDLLMHDQFEEIFTRCWRVARKDEVNLLVTIKTLLETWQASKNLR